MDGCHVLRSKNGNAHAQHGEYQQRCQAVRAVFFLQAARFWRQRRHHVWLKESQQENEEHVKTYQHEAGDECALVQVTHAAAQLVGQDDQHQ